jgi:hypothetical protein
MLQTIGVLHLDPVLKAVRNLIMSGPLQEGNYDAYIQFHVLLLWLHADIDFV